jgi:excisionase family DNA binding protein
MCYPIAFLFVVELPIWVYYTWGMIHMLGKNYYTVTQAAELAGCTVSYVRRLLREKTITGEKFGERAWIIPANQLEKLKHSPTGKAGKPRIGKKIR